MSKVYVENDLLSVLLALEKRVHRTLQVASLGILTNINTTTKECSVKIFPTDNGKENEVYCLYAENLEEDLTIGSIVIILFLNKRSKRNLQLFKNDITNKIILEETNNHSEKNGVVIQILRKKV